MTHLSDIKLNRRAFLNRLGYITAAGVVNPVTLNLMGMAEAAAQGASDYKALVCVTLNGGNDQANTFVPVDPANYKIYKQARQNIALEHSALLPLIPNTPLSDGLKLGFHPSLKRLNNLFHLNKLAVLQNVGTLIEPTTLQQYNDRSVPLPRMLFSHYDQQILSQSTASEAFREGWGGRLGDMILNQNTNSMFSCINAADNSLFLSGTNTSPLTVSDSGIQPIYYTRENAWLYGSQKCAANLRKLITSPCDHIMEDYLTSITRRSIEAEKLLSTALNNSGELTTVFDENNPLAVQLKIIARLIKSRNELGLKRQVFYVNLSEFDTHANMLTTHAKQLGFLDDALGSFYEALEEINMTQSVTTFTASEFGRTYSSNGDGSDHGWGSHHMILGGAVKGKDFYGQSPQIGLNTPTDVGQGRLLPTTSFDQYTATLAKWFGVPDSDLYLISPSLKNFTQRDLGFMNV